MTDDWPEPKVTGNSGLLVGFIAGCLSAHGKDQLYRAVEFWTESGEVIVENLISHTRFCVTVRQIGGPE